MSKQRTGRLEIAHKLRGLARDMNEIAGLMDHYSYSSLDHWAMHAMQLAGAAGMARGWADAIEAALTFADNVDLSGGDIAGPKPTTYPPQMR